MCPLEIDHYLEAATLRLCGSKGQKSYRICYDQSCKRENAAPDLRQGNAHACCAQKTVRGGGGGGGGGEGSNLPASPSFILYECYAPAYSLTSTSVAGPGSVPMSNIRLVTSGAALTEVAAAVGYRTGWMAMAKALAPGWSLIQVSTCRPGVHSLEGL